MKLRSKSVLMLLNAGSLFKGKSIFSLNTMKIDCSSLYSSHIYKGVGVN